eukprot:1940943-Pyramimonas_sp.AAC.1
MRGVGNGQHVVKARGRDADDEEHGVLFDDGELVGFEVELLLVALSVRLAEQDVQFAAVVEPLMAARDDVVAVDVGASGLVI